MEKKVISVYYSDKDWTGMINGKSAKTAMMTKDTPYGMDMIFVISIDGQTEFTFEEYYAMDLIIETTMMVSTGNFEDKDTVFF